MKCQIPEISWHNKDPVYSVDFQPKQSDSDDFCRVASGGSDSHVLIWFLSLDEGAVKLDLAADLTRHQRAVNCVRWSPNGKYLASCDDESVIIIWQKKAEAEASNLFDRDDGSDGDKEIWLSFKTLRGHMEDVYDLSFSADSNYLISGSVDNTAMVWDVQKAKSLAILRDHKGFVQGVAWDPLNKLLATLSTDRHLRFFDVKTKKVVQRNFKSTIPVPENNPLYKKSIRLFHDDTLQTFFRRLSFSPDGSLIVCPSGVAEIDGASGNAKPINTTYIYSRYCLEEPVLVLPSPDQFTIATRFCPLLFELRESKSKPSIPLPYRMIFAVATKCSVYLYDTQQKIPFGLISNIHYTRLTDLTWSHDGKFLLVSSTDGYCSIVQFADDELGTVYKEKSVQEIINANTEKEDDKKKKKKKTKKSTAPKIENATVVSEEKENEKMDVDDQDISLRKLPESIKEIIPVDKIIKSSELFSPEKKLLGSPATPIEVRKMPRVPDELKNDVKDHSEHDKKSPPATSEAKLSVTTPKASLSKTPNRIEVRRFPRTSLHPPTTPSSSATSSKNDDDWPKPISGAEANPIEKKLSHPEEIMSPSSKTPRRVELHTITTPKSKKKLL